MSNTRSILICLLGLFFIAYVNLLRSEPSAFIGQLMQQFQLSPKDFGRFAFSYFLTYVLALISAGLIVDIFGSRIVLVLATVLATVGNYIFGHATSMTSLIQGRALIGFATAFAIIGVLKMIALALPKRHFVLYVGLLMPVAMLVSVFGTPPLKTLAASSGWQHTTSILNWIGILCLVLIVFLFADKDYLGVKRKIIALDELLAVLKNSKIWVAGLVSMLGFIFFSSFIFLWAAPFLKQNFNVVEAARFSMLAIFGFASGAIIAGIIADITQKRQFLLVIGYLLTAILFVILLYSPNLSSAAIAALLFFMGFFLGTNVLCYAIVYDNCSSANVGFALGLFALITMCGNLLIQPLIGHLFITSTGQKALTIIPVALVIGGLLALYLHKPKKVVISATHIGKELILYWQGKGGLGRAYWVIYTLGSLFVSTFFYSLMYGLVTSSQNLSKLFFVLDSLLVLAYQVFATVCVWRCANNTTWWRGWKYIARISVILGLLFAALGFLQINLFLW